MMRAYTFDVTFTQRIYRQGLHGSGEMNYAGTQRATVPFVVVAESQALAEAEIVNDRNFYHHQEPVVKLVSDTKVDVVLVVTRA